MAEDTAVVILDIGGTIFKTTAGTLKKFPDSRFANDLESAGHTNGRQITLFYDRDPEHFRYVLNFCRMQSLATFPTNRAVLRELMSEAIFYEIDEMETHIRKSQVVIFKFCTGHGHPIQFEERVVTLTTRAKTSKIAKLAEFHGESGIPVYMKTKSIPGFTPANFIAVIEYLKFGPTKMNPESLELVQTMSTDFLNFWGLQPLLRIRHQKHNDRVRKISHSVSVPSEGMLSHRFSIA